MNGFNDKLRRKLEMMLSVFEVMGRNYNMIMRTPVKSDY